MGDHPGIRLKEELKNRHVSARQAAAAMGIPGNRLTEIMRGRRRMTLDTARRVAAYLDQPVEDWYLAQIEYDLEERDENA